MERSVQPRDKENMKMAMLKHEETFREQVSELHRLYRVQKMLMRDMKKGALRRQQPSDHQNGVLDRSNVESKRVPNAASCSYYQFHGRPRGPLDLERPAEDYADANDGANAATGAGDESEVELTLATGSHRRKKEETSLTSDSGTSLSSSSTESGGENLKFQDWGLSNRGFPAAGMKDLSGGGGMRGDRLEQPPWLFQCLSLNMT